MPALGFFAPLLLGAVCAAQTGDPRLAAIIERMADNLRRVPNYTCTQTVDRFKRGEPCRDCEYRDRLRLDVAFAGTHEQFAWPGDSEFADRNIFELIGTGTIVTGDFASFASHVFVMDHPDFTYTGEAVLGGRRAHRYDYRVGADRTTFGAQIGEERGNSAYSGSFWADAETQDVIRLAIEATEFPRRLDMAEVKAAVSYARIPIGRSDFLLPRSTEAEILTRKGILSRNRTEYNACRQYVSESTIRFGEEPSAAPGGMKREPADRPLPLPAGLQLSTYLASAVRLREGAVGDPVTFIVAREVSEGAVRVPKGALLEGRIVTLVEHLRPAHFTTLGIRTTAIKFNGTRVEFRGSLARVIGYDTESAHRGPQSIRFETRGNRSMLYLGPGQRQIAKGFQFYWNSLPQERP